MTGLVILLLQWLVRQGWRVFKIVVFLAILWGAIASLSATDLPVVGDFIAWAKSTKLDFFGGAFLSWIAENWLTFAITVIFLTTLRSRWALNELSETGGYTRIFIATMMNYFGVDTETPSGKRMQEQGVWPLIKKGFEELWWGRIMLFIQPHDDRLDAKAVREGEEVRLADDIKKAVRAEVPDIDEEKPST